MSAIRQRCRFRGCREMFCFCQTDKVFSHLRLHGWFAAGEPARRHRRKADGHASTSCMISPALRRLPAIQWIASQGIAQSFLKYFGALFDPTCRQSTSVTRNCPQLMHCPTNSGRFRLVIQRFRIGAPVTAQRTAFEKYIGA